MTTSDVPPGRGPRLSSARITHYGAGSGLTAARPLALRLEDSYRAELDAWAEELDAPVSAVARDLIRGALDLRARPARRTPEAERLVNLVRQAAGLTDLDGRGGTARASDPDTARRAASSVSIPRARSQRAEALRIIGDRMDKGATTDEVIAVLEARARAAGRQRPAVNGIARRVTDLLQAGAIEELRVDEPGNAEGPGHGRIRTRQTRHGRDATVYGITALGRQWLDLLGGEWPAA